MSEKASPERIEPHHFFTNLTIKSYNTAKYRELITSNKTETIL